MTLIAFSTHKDRADILTDTFSYSWGARRTGSASKVHPLPHLDAAYATQGSCDFAALWDFRAGLLRDVATFDDFVQEASSCLRDMWTVAGQANNPPADPSTVFVIGYSPQAGRFRAYQFAAQMDFERHELEAPFIIPTPFTLRPSDLELAQIRGVFAGGPEEEGLLALIEDWHQRPEFVAPTTVKGWVQLGKHARESRSMAPAATRLKVFVAGDLFHSVLKRGEFRTTRVHRFNDTGAEFAQMVAGTINPVSQRAPCIFCDSGRPFVDCCLAAQATEACRCGSGKEFGVCCSVRAES